MYRDLVRLIFKFLGWIIPRLLWVMGRLFFLSLTSVTSLFVGVPLAVDRLANSWIEDATNRGLAWAYNPDIREGLKALAYTVLIMGWITTIALLIFVISLLVNG